MSLLAYQQLGELYQASRLLVNAFQPSMKLQSKDREGEHERRISDEAKTPWQRVLLSDIFPDEIQQKWRKDVEVLDPLRLVQHVETLQRAVWRCAQGGSGTTLVRFSLSACVSAAHLPQRASSDVLVERTPDFAETRDWSRSIHDPFLGEWEQIHAYVRARPMASAGEILREWQQRFPERFVETHLNILQQRLRERRASLVASQVESRGGQTDDTTAFRASSKPASARPSLSPGADEVAVRGSGPEAAPSVLPPPPEEETRPAHQPQASVSETSSIKDEGKEQDDPTVQAPPVVGSVHAPLPAMMTIDHAITLFLQGEHTHNWEPKTREWHETSLGQLQRYLAGRKLLLLSSLTPGEIREWLAFLRKEALVTGAFRAQSTISTYARSAHAWCAWLAKQGYLEQSPFARIPFPQGKKRDLHIMKPETFERFLDACSASQTKRATVTAATARNRAILWVLWDTGLLVSEMCALNVGDVDLTQGTRHVQGTGPKGRTVPLTPEVQQALTMYLEQHRLRAGMREASDAFFLSERRARLAKNGFTQLFHRLCARTGLEDRHLTPTMLRETFAVRFLQTGGPPQALQRLLGLAESTSIKRYLDAAGVARKLSYRVRNYPQT